MNKRATAHHEAGHVAVSHVLGRRVTRVTLVGDDESHGRTSYEPLDDFDPDRAADRTRQQIESKIMTNWAGTLAEERFAESTEEELDEGARPDVDEIRNLALYATGSASDVDAHIEELRLRTEALVASPDVQVVIKAIADALLAEDTLSAERVQAVIRTAVHSNSATGAEDDPGA